MYRIIFYSLLFGLMHGCSEKPAAAANETRTCGSLDTIFAEIESFESRLTEDRPWEALEPELQGILIRLEENVKSGNTACHFNNHQNYPEKGRFGFIDSLSQLIISDSVPDGIFYLIRLRGIFSYDAEISEYLSEKLAIIAQENVPAYTSYFIRNPAQQQMLLNSTRWQILEKKTVLEKYSQADSAAAISSHLRNLTF